MGSILTIASTLLLLTLVVAQTDNQKERESGIFFSKIFPRVFDRTASSGLETPIQIRAFLYMNLAAWNAWSNYHPSAVDIFNRTRFKRPESEHTLQNKNVAMMFAMFRCYEVSPVSFGGPSHLEEYRKIIREEGYDPEDRSMNLLSPVGIGNREGYDTARLMAIDGWNADGSLTATDETYRIPFQDYTGYTPKNSPWGISYPFRWQPVLESNAKGFFFRQEFVVPQIGTSLAFGFSPSEVENRRLASPFENQDAKIGEEKTVDQNKLRFNAMDVLQRSAKLSEKQQILAEFFDNKVKAFQTSDNPAGVAAIAAAIRFAVLPKALDWGFDDDVIYGLGANIVTYDATLLAWKEKRRLDAVRPTGQTMKYLFGEKKMRVWGGAGKRPVMIRPAEWQPYIRTMPHAEFPSGSACLCSALIEHAMENTGGRNNFQHSFVVPKGSSKFYPGKIPSKDTRITIKRLSDWAKLCGASRLWAGVHFRSSIPAGESLCSGAGKRAQEVVDGLLRGSSNGQWLQWLPDNVHRFWED